MKIYLVLVLKFIILCVPLFFRKDLLGEVDMILHAINDVKDALEYD